MEIITYALGIAFIIMTATFALWHYKWEYDRNFKGKKLLERIVGSVSVCVFISLTIWVSEETSAFLSILLGLVAAMGFVAFCFIMGAVFSLPARLRWNKKIRFFGLPESRFFVFPPFRIPAFSSLPAAETTTGYIQPPTEKDSPESVRLTKYQLVRKNEKNMIRHTVKLPMPAVFHRHKAAIPGSKYHRATDCPRLSALPPTRPAAPVRSLSAAAVRIIKMPASNFCLTDTNLFNRLLSR